MSVSRQQAPSTIPCRTVGYLSATAGIAWVVYRKAGLAILRRARFDVDVVWAGALVVTGLVTLIS